MLALILLLVTSPNLPNKTDLEGFSTNLSDPTKVDEFVAELQVKPEEHKQALDAANSQERNTPFKCPPWKPGQKSGLRDLVSVDDMLNFSPREIEECADIRSSDAAAYAKRNRPQAHIIAPTGGKDIIANSPVDVTPNIDAELAAQAASVEKASKEEAVQPLAEQLSTPIPFILTGGFLLLVIGFVLGRIRKRS